MTSHSEFRKKLLTRFFSVVQIWVESKFFKKFLFDILQLKSETMDPHLFADHDPGSQNLADPTDPNPSHWFICLYASYSWPNDWTKSAEILWVNPWVSGGLHMLNSSNFFKNLIFSDAGHWLWKYHYICWSKKRTNFNWI